MSHDSSPLLPFGYTQHHLSIEAIQLIQIRVQILGGAAKTLFKQPRLVMEWSISRLAAAWDKEGRIHEHHLMQYIREIVGTVWKLNTIEGRQYWKE